MWRSRIGCEFTACGPCFVFIAWVTDHTNVVSAFHETAGQSKNRRYIAATFPHDKQKAAQRYTCFGKHLTFPLQSVDSYSQTERSTSRTLPTLSALVSVQHQSAAISKCIHRKE